jgi:hypothetical protein
MRVLPRTTICNPIAVAENGGKPYSTGYYETHTTTAPCCGNDPDLCLETGLEVFIKTASYVFKCSKCQKEGPEGLTPNAAAVGWNKMLAD